jgi:hypothetical protein
MKFKSVWRERFTVEEVERINRIRFKMTRVLKEFNRRNSKYVAMLLVVFPSPDEYEEGEVGKDVFFYVDVDKRVRDPDSEMDEFVRMAFYYAVDKDLRDVMSFESYANTSNFYEAFDLLLLFLRLAVVFYTA